MRCAICTLLSCTSLVVRTTASRCWRAEIIDTSQHKCSCSVRVAVALGRLALPLLLLGLLGRLLLLLLALAFSLLLGRLLLVVLALLGLLRRSAGLSLLAGRGDGRGGKNLSGGGGLGKRCRLDIGPVQVLVFRGPLGGSLLVGAAKFLLNVSYARILSSECANLRRVCQPPSSSSSRWQQGPCPSAWGTGRAP